MDGLAFVTCSVLFCGLAGGSLWRARRSVRARQVAEARLRAALESSPDGVLAFDRAGVIALANVRAQRLFGHARLAGVPVSELLPSAVGEASAWLDAAEPVEPVEMTAQRPDGTRFLVELSLSPATSVGLRFASVRDATETKMVAQALAHQAHHDALTGLPNRLLFLERLQLALARARRSGRPLAVVFIDLDDFKPVNDTRGHEVGDRLLQLLTPRLQAAVRDGDTLARLGGDEFVALCEDLSEEADAVEVAQRLADVASRPLSVAGGTHSVSASAGVVMVRDAHQATATAVLRDADAAMYTAKAGGKARVALFDQTMREELLERVAIEAALREAPASGELRLHYQPVVALEPDRIVAVEALLRWQHPQRGLLEPGEFLHVAESAGMLGRIGEWVIEQACAQAVRWRDRFPELELPVSVNVSPLQLKRPGLAEFVARILRLTRLEPWLLALEVRESALHPDSSGASRRELRALKALGVGLIVDDFGVGYSSLPGMRELMVDGLKLDRSLVHGLARGDDGGALVGAVLSMADAIDAEVTAEGVETDAQAMRLLTAGCDFAQGYLFAAPAPAEQLTELIARRQRQDGCEISSRALAR